MALLGWKQLFHTISVPGAFKLDLMQHIWPIFAMTSYWWKSISSQFSLSGYEVMAKQKVMAAQSSFFGLPGTTWDISSFGASNPRPKDPFSSKRGTKYWRKAEGHGRNIKSDIWSKMHQGYAKHARPWAPECTFYQDLNIPTYLIPFFWKRDPWAWD